MPSNSSDQLFQLLEIAGDDDVDGDARRDGDDGEDDDDDGAEPFRSDDDTAESSLT